MNILGGRINNISSLEKIVSSIPRELISFTRNIFISEWTIKEIFKNEKKLYLFSDIVIFADILNKNGENKYQYEFEKYIEILDYDIEKTTINNNKTVRFVETDRNKTSNSENNKLIHNNNIHSHLNFEKCTHTITDTLCYFESEEACNGFIREYKEQKDILLNNNNKNNNTNLNITKTIDQIENKDSHNPEITVATDIENNLTENASAVSNNSNDNNDIVSLNDTDVEHLNTAFNNLEIENSKSYASSSTVTKELKKNLLNNNNNDYSSDITKTISQVDNNDSNNPESTVVTDISSNLTTFSLPFSYNNNYNSNISSIRDIDVGNGYAFGYKADDPKKNGKFPSPLVIRSLENQGFYITI